MTDTLKNTVESVGKITTGIISTPGQMTQAVKDNYDYSYYQEDSMNSKLAKS